MESSYNIYDFEQEQKAQDQDSGRQMTDDESSQASQTQFDMSLEDSHSESSSSGESENSALIRPGLLPHETDSYIDEIMSAGPHSSDYSQSSCETCGYKFHPRNPDQSQEWIESTLVTLYPTISKQAIEMNHYLRQHQDHMTSYHRAVLAVDTYLFEYNDEDPRPAARAFHACFFPYYATNDKYENLALLEDCESGQELVALWLTVCYDYCQQDPSLFHKIATKIPFPGMNQDTTLFEYPTPLLGAFIEKMNMRSGTSQLQRYKEFASDTSAGIFDKWNSLFRQCYTEEVSLINEFVKYWLFAWDNNLVGVASCSLSLVQKLGIDGTWPFLALSVPFQAYLHLRSTPSEEPSIIQASFVEDLKEASNLIANSAKSVKDTVTGNTMLDARKRVSRLLGFALFAGRDRGMEQFEPHFLRFVDRSDRVDWSGDSAFDIINKFLDLIIDVFSFTDGNYVPGNTVRNFSDHSQATEWLRTGYNNVVDDTQAPPSSVSASVIPLSKWKSVFNECASFMKRIQDQRDVISRSGFEWSTAKHQQSLVLEMAIGLNKKDPVRTLPLNVCLVGDARAGKTSAVMPAVRSLVMPILLNEEDVDIQRLERMTCSVNMSEKYMSNYKQAQHLFVVLDEISCLKPKVGDVSAYMSQLTSMLGEAPMLVNSAAVHDKGNVFYNPLVNFCISNVDDLGANDIMYREPAQALYKRFTVPVEGKKTRRNPGTTYFRVECAFEQDKSYPELDVSREDSQSYAASLRRSFAHLKFFPMSANGQGIHDTPLFKQVEGEWVPDEAPLDIVEYLAVIRHAALVRKNSAPVFTKKIREAFGQCSKLFNEIQQASGEIVDMTYKVTSELDLYVGYHLAICATSLVLAITLRSLTFLGVFAHCLPSWLLLRFFSSLVSTRGDQFKELDMMMKDKNLLLSHLIATFAPSIKDIAGKRRWFYVSPPGAMVFGFYYIIRTGPGSPSDDVAKFVDLLFGMAKAIYYKEKVKSVYDKWVSSKSVMFAGAAMTAAILFAKYATDKLQQASFVTKEPVPIKKETVSFRTDSVVIESSSWRTLDSSSFTTKVKNNVMKVVSSSKGKSRVTHITCVGDDFYLTVKHSLYIFRDFDDLTIYNSKGVVKSFSGREKEYFELPPTERIRTMDKSGRELCLIRIRQMLPCRNIENAFCHGLAVPLKQCLEGTVSHVQFSDNESLKLVEEPGKAMLGLQLSYVDDPSGKYSLTGRPKCSIRPILPGFYAEKSGYLGSCGSPAFFIPSKGEIKMVLGFAYAVSNGRVLFEVITRAYLSELKTELLPLGGFHLASGEYDCDFIIAGAPIERSEQLTSYSLSKPSHEDTRSEAYWCERSGIDTGLIDFYGVLEGYRPPRQISSVKWTDWGRSCADWYKKKTGDDFDLVEPKFSGYVDIDGVWKSPGRNAILSFRYQAKNVDLNLLRDACDDAFEKFSQCALGKYDSYLSVEDAVSKNPESDLTSSMVLNTAAGFGWPGKKARYFEEYLDTRYDVVRKRPTEELRTILDYYQDLYRAGNRTYPIFKGTYKDEPRARKKVADRKIRLFSVAPLPYLVLQRQMFGIFANIFTSDYKTFETVAGMNCMSSSWKDLFSYLKWEDMLDGVEYLLQDGDYKEFDTSQGVFQEYAARLIERLKLHWGSLKEEEKPMFRAMCSDFLDAYVLVGCDLLNVYGINMSGHFLTLVINNIVNSLMFRYVYGWLKRDHWRRLNYAPRPSWAAGFSMDVRFTALGDDNLYSYLKTISEWFNFANIVRCFELHGITYTPADKDSTDYEARTLEQITICKRYFRPRILINADGDPIDWVCCPIELKSIVKMVSLGVQSKALTFDEWQSAPLNRALHYELMMHGKELYDEFFSPGGPLGSAKWQVPPPSYEETVRIFLANSHSWVFGSEIEYVDEDYESFALLGSISESDSDTSLSCDSESQSALTRDHLLCQIVEKGGDEEAVSGKGESYLGSKPVNRTLSKSS